MSVQYLLGLPDQALSVLQKVLLQVFTSGSLYDRARAQFLWVRCQASVAAKQNDDTSSKAGVNRRTNDGWTALHSASNWGHYNVASYLLSRGADVNAQTNSSQTALHIAASSTHKHSEKLLQVLLMDRRVDFRLTNSLGETAQTVANRCSKYSYLFEMCDDSLNELG